MLDRIVENARAQAEHTAGTAAIGLGASIALFIGLGFWTIAGWLLLLTMTTAINAAMIIGALYTGAGLIGFVIVSVRGKKKVAKPVVPPTPSPPSFDGLVAAFMSGMSAGAKTRRH